MRKAVVITDFDGTLVDTFEANFLAYQEAFSKHGLSLSKETYKKCFGLRFPEFMDFVGVNDESIREKIKKTKKEVYPYYLGHVRLNYGLVSFMQMCKQNGERIGIASTASIENINNVLKRFNLEGVFDFIVSGEDVQHGKPDPEVYQKALCEASFNPHYTIAPEAALVFEDSETGINAAIAAGIDYIKINKF